ncbi:MAG: twin-arginine translocation signal domain-containing protein [Chloroflexi bacterium]|nr:twin-arginine translocation signal domain-containing protein [Chloroflexota bacterium]
MAKKSEPEQKPGQTRRSFLAKMGLGAAALAIVGGPLGMLGRFRNSPDETASQGFPGEDSIFHPASDPRQDSRRNG